MPALRARAAGRKRCASAASRCSPAPTTSATAGRPTATATCSTAPRSSPSGTPCSRTASLRMLSRSTTSEADKALGAPQRELRAGAVADLVASQPRASPTRSSIGRRARSCCAPGASRPSAGVASAALKDVRDRLNPSAPWPLRYAADRPVSSSQWLTGRQTSTAAARASFWTICGFRSTLTK